MNVKAHIQNAQMLTARADGEYGNQLMVLSGICDALIAIAMILDEINERAKVEIEREELRKIGFEQSFDPPPELMDPDQ